MTQSFRSRSGFNHSLKIAVAAAGVAALGGLVAPASFADYYPGDYGDYTPITNGNFFANSQQTSDLLMFQAEYAVKVGNYEVATQLIRRSIDENGDDLDSHKTLALCLEQKLKKQVDKDPDVLEECVKEWLIVMRNEVGFEKGTNAKSGKGNVIGNRYADEDMQLLAKAHLKKLVGRPPKNSESDKKYLADVLGPAEETVKGKVLTAKDKDSDRRKMQAGREPKVKNEFE